jgi:hypothetical protein
VINIVSLINKFFEAKSVALQGVYHFFQLHDDVGIEQDIDQECPNSDQLF